MFDLCCHHVGVGLAAVLRHVCRVAMAAIARQCLWQGGRGCPHGDKVKIA